MFENASRSAGLRVFHDLRSGARVSDGPWELPADTAATGLLPDGSPGSTGFCNDARFPDTGDTFDEAAADHATRTVELAGPDARNIPDHTARATESPDPHTRNIPDHGSPAAGTGPADVAVPVGVQLAAVLAGLDAATADGYDLVEAAAGWARLAAWVTARQATVLAALAARPELRPADTGYRSVNPITNTAVEVAARTHVTTRQAENLVGHAVQLAEDFPATQRSLEAGRIDERRAKVISSELGSQVPEVRRRVEAAVLPAAESIDSVSLRRRIRQLLLELAPVQAERRCQQARTRRDVTMIPAEDGMAYVDAYLPAEDAVAVTSVLNAAARTLKRQDTAAGLEPRTAAQRRADALSALAWTALGTQQIGEIPPAAAHRAGSSCACGNVRDGSNPRDATREGTHDGNRDSDSRSDGRPPAPTPLASAKGRPVGVNVTFAFGSLAGLDDQHGHLEGYGPIPATVARQLAAAGIWQWVGTDPVTGQVLDHGTTRYRPPQALIDHVVLRDRTCRTPGCHRPATSCDIDHRSPYSRGGPTSADNCQSLCRTHHLLKHNGGWRVHNHTGGATVWTSPTGHTYAKPPEQVGPVIEPGPGPSPADAPPPF